MGVHLSVVDLRSMAMDSIGDEVYAVLIRPPSGLYKVLLARSSKILCKVYDYYD